MSTAVIDEFVLDLAEASGRSPFEPLDPGTYRAQIESIEAGNGPKGPYFKVTYMALGTHKVTDILSLARNNLGKLSQEWKWVQFFDAVGVDRSKPVNLRELMADQVGKEVALELTIRPWQRVNAETGDSETAYSNNVQKVMPVSALEETHPLA